VLLSSPHEEEVKEIVRSVGWWCKWFERFVPWSPTSVSCHREVWLSCYGVPLLVWGVSLFKAIAFKFGTFIDIDAATRDLQRGDVARVRVSTNREKLIDSSMVIMVLRQKFTIRVLEDNGGGHDEASSMASNDGVGSFLATVAGGSVDGSDDGDPSQSCQVLMGLERQVGGKGGNMSTKKDLCQKGGVADCSPNVLGNPCGLANALVNEEDRCHLSCYEVNRGRFVESAGSGGERRQETNLSLPCVLRADSPPLVPCDLSRDKGAGNGAVFDDIGLAGPVIEEWASDLGPPKEGGVDSAGPAVLRTKQGDFLLHGPTNSNPFLDEIGGVESNL
ncbi:DUF4283 domain protein, partial [Trifolium medium]|nr:DUF4283 domain protein [Trifolium medium]